MTAKAKRRALILLCAALTLPACYRYVPASLDTVPAGDNIRVTITREGAFELSEITEVTAAAPVVRGEIVRTEGETLLMSVPVGSRREGFHTVGLGTTIRVPVGEILGVERREFDAVRSGALAVGTAGMAATVILVIMESFGSGGGPDDPVDPEEIRLPLRLFSIPFGH